ncbi:MAG: glycosyltransferase family 4 protein [Alphaproteobacteria bacterium]
MKITFVINQLSAGGAERVLCALANQLSSFHDVQIITFSCPTDAPFYPLAATIQLTQLGAHKSSARFILKRLWRLFIKLFLLRTQLKQIKSGPIISFITETNIAVLLLNKGLNHPVIVSERIDPAHHKLPWIVEWMRFKSYKWAHKIVVQTGAVASYFPASFQPLIEIIPNSIKKFSGFYKVQEKVRHIVSVGRLVLQKDQASLIKAFSTVVKNNPDLILTIYGEGDQRNDLENLIRNLNLTDKVFLPGVTKNIQEQLVKADLFVFPSRYEGFPNALCEAMAVGLPVIASACSGNVDVVQDGVNGLLFPIEDVTVLTEKMLTLIKDTKLRSALSKQAKKISTDFSEDRILKLWEKVINS